MRPFVENLPFLCIFLAILTGIVSAVIPRGRVCYWMTVTVAGIIAVLSAVVLQYTYGGNLSFTYSMGRFAAPYGNAIQCGPLQALLAMVFSVVLALALAGGKRDLFHDVLPGKLRLYFTMVNLLEASLLALVYTNDVFTGYVFIEISTIAACALVMAKDNGPNLIATIRYLFMSLLGSGLFLIGLTLLNSITGYLLMPSLAQAVAELAESGDYRIPLTVAVGLIIGGLGIKSAMFPFHLWLPGCPRRRHHGIFSHALGPGAQGIHRADDHHDDAGVLHGADGRAGRDKRDFGLWPSGHDPGVFGGHAGIPRQTDAGLLLCCPDRLYLQGLGLGTTAGVVASCFHILVHACCKPLLFCCAGVCLRSAAITRASRTCGAVPIGT